MIGCSYVSGKYTIFLNVGIMYTTNRNLTDNEKLSLCKESRVMHSDNWTAEELQWSRDGRISDPAILTAGFPLSGQIRLRSDCTWHAGTDFRELQYPTFTPHDVTAQLTVHIAAKICP